MCWSELKDGIWSLPEQRAKNHRALTLPLARQPVAALEVVAADRGPRSAVRHHVPGRLHGLVARQETARHTVALPPGLAVPRLPQNS